MTTQPVMSYADFQLSRNFSGYAGQPVAPQEQTLPMPPPAPISYTPQTAVPYQPQQLPYNPNASPTESWAIEPMPSNVTTPMNPHKGKSLDEIPPMMGWRGY